MRAARCGVKIGSSPPLGPQRRQSRGGAANKKKGSSRKGAKLAEQTKSFNRRAVSATGRHERCCVFDLERLFVLIYLASFACFARVIVLLFRIR